MVDLDDAAKPGAAKVWDECADGNVAFRLRFGNQEATDAALAAAKHVVTLRIVNNRLSPVAIEPRVAIAQYDAIEDSYTLHSASQNPHGTRMEMSHIFHAPETSVSCHRRRRFRRKGGAFPDDALVLWAARRSGGHKNGRRLARML